MKRFNYWLSVLALLGLLLPTACQKEEVDITPTPNEPAFDEPVIQGGNSIKLGKQLENPYSVVNMQKAWDNLKKVSDSNLRVSGSELTITTSHLYVKFKPKDDFEQSLLRRDTTITLYTYPLDYEIEKTGDYYHDPAVPAGQPTYQYVAVKANYKFPDVAYEILEKLYIPEEAEVANGKVATSVKGLVDEALRITGNLDKKDGGLINGKILALQSIWRPSGRIRVWDAAASRFVPVVGVEVRATRWFTTHKGTTNSNGFYSCNGTFDRPANYSIDWDTYHFSVRSGTLGQAVLDGPKQEASWNPDLGISGTDQVLDTQQYYALIFQGAHDYYYGNRFGLSRPPENSTLHPQVKIAADISERQNAKPSHAAIYARTLGIFPSIYVRTWGNRADRVYAVTIHELAHSAHWNMDRDAFRYLAMDAYVLLDASSEATFESWANGVEWQFAMHRYRTTFSQPRYEYEENLENGNYQEQMLRGFNRNANDLIYTSIVVDLIDDDNQRFTRGHGGSPAFPQDQVAGYTILEVQEGMRGAISWNRWRNNMINIHNNPTEGFVNELFDNWYR
jgi:hypothetical protein